MFRKIGELIKHRELVLRLAVKDLKVRYKSPWLGLMWALLVPIFMMLILTVIFRLFLKIDVGPYPFSLFLITALFPWNFFAVSFSTATTNIVESGSLIKKVYFPREVIPVSVVMANLINFFLALLVLFVLLLILPNGVSLLTLLLPVIILLQTIFVIGIALIFSSLQVHYRDVKYIVEVLLLGWFYVTPIFYPLQYVAEFISEKGLSPIYLHLYLLNPMASFVTVFRGVFLSGYLDFLPSGLNYWLILLECSVMSFLTLFIGFKVFKRLEPGFADLT